MAYNIKVTWSIPPYHLGQRFFNNLKKARGFKRYLQRGLGFKAKLTIVD